MSTYTEISRLIAARGKIRDKLTALGLATAQDKLDILAGVLDGVADCGAVEKNLREGETYQFVIPADLAYGPRWMGTEIPANSTLRFTVELLEVNPEG